MIPSRRSFLACAAALAATPPLSRAASGGPKLVVVLANGGWDPTYCFDPKIGVPGVEGPEVDRDPSDPDDVEAVSTFGGIPIATNAVRRPSVSAFFERWADRAAVINGVAMGSIAHQACRIRLLTGTGRPANPDVTAIAGRVLGADLPLGSLDFSGLGFAGDLAAYSATAGANAQLRALVDPSVAFAPAPGASPTFVPPDTARAAVDAWTARRNQSFSARFGAEHELAAWRDARLRADRLRADGPELLAGLPLGLPPTFAAQSTVGVDVLARGLCRAILLDSGEGWDSHLDTASQHEAFESFFAGLDALVSALDATGQLDDTLVAVVSEMGRMPVRNSALGKDHWSHTSALLLGGPVRGGRTLGATDDGLVALPVDLDTGAPDDAGQVLQYDALAAGILESIGVDPGEWLPDATPYRGPYS